MTTYTAGDQINRAFRLLGILAEGETPSASMSQDALMAMNQMIESWNTERLSTFVTQDQVYTWPAGFISRDLGPTGDFVGNRPVLMDDATYYKAPNGVSYGIKFINQQQYDGIAVKTVTSTYPQVCWVNMGFPNVTLTVYPKPTQDLEWHMISVQELDQPADLATPLYFPPGYLRAFTYNLAMEIAPEFGVEPSPQVMRIAMASKRGLKRINNPDDVMALPYALVANRQRFNIYSGNF
jgi:hypothetical protein